MVRSGYRRMLPAAEHGASMIELAVILPLILTLLAGVIDIGLALRREQVIFAAAKAGARAGSAVRNNLPCANVDPAPSINCSALSTIAPTTVDAVAKIAACNYLRDSGLLGEHEYVVSAAVTPTNPAAPTSTAGEPTLLAQNSLGTPANAQQQVLTVQVKNSGKNCYVCWILSDTLANVKATSAYALENTCTLPPPGP